MSKRKFTGHSEARQSRNQPEQVTGVLLTIDVAHPPLPQERVEEILRESLARVRNSPQLRVLKVVHGYGSSGEGGSTKSVVLNWTYQNRSRIRAVFQGEQYNLFEREVQTMRKEIGPFRDNDLEVTNPGITICWIR